MNSNKEKYFLECLISSPDLFSRCQSILKPTYHKVKEYSRTLEFILKYYNKRSALPIPRIIEAEIGVELEIQQVTSDQYEYLCDEIEKFCRESAFEEALLDAADKVSKEDENAIANGIEKMKKVLEISLDKDLGVNFFEDSAEVFERLSTTDKCFSTGVDAIDRNLNGGLARRELTLLSANSGGGKSLMMNNLAMNYVRQGFNAIYLQLEDTEDKTFKRAAHIWTGITTENWENNIEKMSDKIESSKENSGKFFIKRLPLGSSCSSFRSYFKQFHIINGFYPDVLVVDYLDLMHPNGGIKNLSISDQDKQKSEELSELLYELDMIGISASQQNREGIDNNSPNQKVIAGGISKVNTVNNYISIQMNKEMRLQGEMKIHFLKTRSSSGVGHSEVLGYDSDTLRIGDPSGSSIHSILHKKRKQINVDYKNMPSVIFGDNEMSETEAMVAEINDSFVDDINRELDAQENDYVVLTPDDIEEIEEHFTPETHSNFDEVSYLMNKMEI